MPCPAKNLMARELSFRQDNQFIKSAPRREDNCVLGQVAGGLDLHTVERTLPRNTKDCVLRWWLLILALCCFAQRMRLRGHGR
jgi:hypothetical protein